MGNSINRTGHMSMLRTVPGLVNQHLKRVVACCAFLAVAGCSSTIDYTRMDPTEQARTIKEYRDRAKRHLALYRETREVEELMKVVGLERETTKVTPGSCPTCFRELGLSLSMAGWHYFYAWNDALRSAEEAPTAADAEDYEAEAEEHRRTMRRFLQESNNAYGVFFRHPDAVFRAPEDYRRAMINHELLEDYVRALDFLEFYVSALGADAKDPGTKRLIERTRRRYTEAAQLQRERPRARRG